MFYKYKFAYKLYKVCCIETDKSHDIMGARAKIFLINY